MTIVKAQYRVTLGDQSIDSSIEVQIDLSRFRDTTLMEVSESLMRMLRDETPLIEPTKAVCQNGVPTS